MNVEELPARNGSINSEEERSNKLRSVKGLLTDPSLKAFNFIHPSAFGFSEDYDEEVKPKSSSKSFGILRYYSGGRSEKKLFKLKVSVPAKAVHKKLRGLVIFPSSTTGDCRWNFQAVKGRKMIFVPRYCTKDVGRLDSEEMRKHRVISLLIPRKNKRYGWKKNGITKSFVIVSYGKRFGKVLRKLAAKGRNCRLIISNQRNDNS